MRGAAACCVGLNTKAPAHHPFPLPSCFGSATPLAHTTSNTLPFPGALSHGGAETCESPTVPGTAHPSEG